MNNKKRAMLGEFEAPQDAILRHAVMMATINHKYDFTEETLYELLKNAMVTMTEMEFCKFMDRSCTADAIVEAYNKAIDAKTTMMRLHRTDHITDKIMTLPAHTMEQVVMEAKCLIMKCATQIKHFETLQSLIWVAFKQISREKMHAGNGIYCSGRLSEYLADDEQQAQAAQIIYETVLEGAPFMSWENFYTTAKQQANLHKSASPG